MIQPNELSPATLARLSATFPFEYPNPDAAVNGALDKLEQLQQGAPIPLTTQPKPGPRTGPPSTGVLHQFIVDGVFEVGDELRWERPNLGQTHIAHVDANGCIVTDDGQAHANPTTAIANIAPGQRPHPWEAWLHTPSGRSISEWREVFRLRKQAELDPGDEGEQPRDWTEIIAVALERLPHGAWTTYGDLSRLTGHHQRAIGGFISRAHELKNAWRVLLAEGKVSPNFAWVGEDRGDIHAYLRKEGVRFSRGLVADPTQRMRVEGLRKLLTQQ